MSLGRFTPKFTAVVRSATSKLFPNAPKNRGIIPHFPLPSIRHGEGRLPDSRDTDLTRGTAVALRQRGNAAMLTLVKDCPFCKVPK